MKPLKLLTTFCLLASIGVAIAITRHLALFANEQTPQVVQASAAGLAAGGNHTCAITTEGGAVCWGAAGLTGNKSNSQQNKPVAVSGLGSSVRMLSSGLRHTCAALKNGQVRCWGRNDFAQLGNGEFEQAASPVPVTVFGVNFVSKLAAGSTHTCALSGGGGVRCWGHNEYGSAGSKFNPQLTPFDIAGLDSGVVHITSGDQFSCALLNTGKVKCWGFIDGIAEGWGGFKFAPVEVPLNKRVKTISAGFKHTCAITEDERVQCWGGNDYGETGMGDITGSNNPQQVLGVTGAIDISAGKYASCAIVRGGSVKCWGINYNGQLGNGSPSEGRPVAITVAGLPRPAIAIGVGRQTEYDANVPTWYGGHACALLDNSTVWCWGDNTYGQLGDGSTTKRFKPVIVKGLDTATETPPESPATFKIALPMLQLLQGMAGPSTDTEDCCEKNDDFEVAFNINDIADVRGSIDAISDPSDFYKVRLSSGNAYKIHLTHSPDAETDLYLYVEENGELKLDKKSLQERTGTEAIEIRPDNTRTFYIVIAMFDLDKRSVYALSVRR